MIALDLTRPDSWPSVLTVDETATVLRFLPDMTPLCARRRVYELVRAGSLPPIGGIPVGQMSLRLRFPKRRVLDLIELEAGAA